MPWAEGYRHRAENPEERAGALGPWVFCAHDLCQDSSCGARPFSLHPGWRKAAGLAQDRNGKEAQAGGATIGMVLLGVLP